jgi:hypothetical protein
MFFDPAQTKSISLIETSRCCYFAGMLRKTANISLFCRCSNLQSREIRRPSRDCWLYFRCKYSQNSGSAPVSRRAAAAGSSC